MRKVLALSSAVFISVAVLTTGAVAAEYFIPKGNTYSPNNERLPLLNSRKDRINARTDEIESENYRKQLEQRRFIEQFNSFEDHVFGGGDRRWNAWQ